MVQESGQFGIGFLDYPECSDCGFPVSGTRFVPDMEAEHGRMAAEILHCGFHPFTELFFTYIDKGLVTCPDIAYYGFHPGLSAFVQKFDHPGLVVVGGVVFESHREVDSAVCPVCSS